MGETNKWPDAWPSDVKKLDGTVTSTMNTGSGDDKAIIVNVNVKSQNDVISYANALVAAGFKKDYVANGSSGHMAGLENDKYGIIVSCSTESSATLELTTGGNSSSSGSDEDSDSSGDSSSD